MGTKRATIHDIREPAVWYRPPSLESPEGKQVVSSSRHIEDLSGFFHNEDAYSRLDADRLVYSVEAYLPVEEGTEGGLFFGISRIEPGRVGREFFMTKGHFHEKVDRAEFYWGLRGIGALIFMDDHRRCWAEWVRPGSLHYVPGGVAHRLANCGDEQLSVGACWPSDAGHDYGSVSESGFACRLLDVDGQPRLVDAEELAGRESG